MQTCLLQNLEPKLALFAKAPRPRNAAWFWFLGQLLLPAYGKSYGAGLTAFLVTKYPGFASSDIRRAVRLRRLYGPEKLPIVIEIGTASALLRARRPKKAITILDPQTLKPTLMIQNYKSQM